MDQQLKVFVTVAEKKNFSRAAEALYMTQPAVSQYIRTLEENIGVRLLDRTNKYVNLNQAGEIVYHHAKEIIGLHTRMQLLVDDLINQATGPISIGASYTFGEYVLPYIIATMKEIYPDIHPVVNIGNTAKIAHEVMHHQLDIGIVEGHFKQEKKLNIETFAEDEMVIVAHPSHPYAKKNHHITIKDLENETWLLREAGSGTREAIEKMFQQQGITPTEKIEFGSTQPIKMGIEAGLGISLLSKWAIQKEINNGDLQILNMEGMPFTRQFSFLTASPFQTKALRVFIELIRQKELTAITNNK